MLHMALAILTPKKKIIFYNNTCNILLLLYILLIDKYIFIKNSTNI